MFRFNQLKPLSKYITNRWILMCLIGLGLFQFGGRPVSSKVEGLNLDSIVIFQKAVFCRNHAWTERVFVQLYVGEEVRICMTHQDTSKYDLKMRFRMYKCENTWRYTSDRKDRFYSGYEPKIRKPIEEFNYDNLWRCCTTIKITEQAIYEIELMPTMIFQMSDVDFLITVKGLNSVGRDRDVAMQRFIDTTYENITYTERWGDTSFYRI
ncbi:MAG: hypothetical protein ACRCYO_01630, partial [Bacteroidia bacterium]